MASFSSELLAHPHQGLSTTRPTTLRAVSRLSLVPAHRVGSTCLRRGLQFPGLLLPSLVRLVSLAIDVQPSIVDTIMERPPLPPAVLPNLTHLTLHSNLAVDITDPTVVVTPRLTHLDASMLFNPYTPGWQADALAQLASFVTASHCDIQEFTCRLETLVHVDSESLLDELEEELEDDDDDVGSGTGDDESADNGNDQPLSSKASFPSSPVTGVHLNFMDVEMAEGDSDGDSDYVPSHDSQDENTASPIQSANEDDDNVALTVVNAPVSRIRVQRVRP